MHVSSFCNISICWK